MENVNERIHIIIFGDDVMLLFHTKLCFSVRKTSKVFFHVQSVLIVN